MLRMARRHAELTQRALAESAGVPQSTVARIEHGQVDPRVGTLETLLRACGFELGIQPAQVDERGVDRSLIVERLALTPTERVVGTARAANFAERLRAARLRKSG